VTDDVQQILQREMARSEPDYVVYVPKSIDGSTFDTGNEHFLVFEGPDGSLMAVWTQSTREGAGDHRIMFSRSEDEGVTWASPRRLVGPRWPGDGPIASWGYPLISKSGRIYVFWNQYQGPIDVADQFTGTMDCTYSDDMGQTWSVPATIPMARSPHDHWDPRVPSNWIVWQKPIRDLQGRWFTGFSRWLSVAVRRVPHKRSWAAESVVEFMRYENIDEDPDPDKIEISWSAWGEQALRVPHYSDPLISVAQEPSLVRLPDDRLFCVMRTITGYIWYSVSADDGYTWCSPRPLLRKDHGLPILAPICCTPIYELSDGRYILFHNNNSGRVDGCEPEDTRVNRRPCFAALGEYRPDAEQPIWFSESKQFMDNDGVRLGPRQGIDIGVYPSFTTRGGNNVLWHPERKFFLLGKRVTSAFLSDMVVPAHRPLQIPQGEGRSQCGTGLRSKRDTGPSGSGIR
jgi:hypothetical protein